MNVQRTFFLLLCSTLAIDAKISMQSLQSSVSQLFKTKKEEESITKEFNDVDQLEILCKQATIFIHTWKQPSTFVEIKKIGSKQQLCATDIDFIYYDHLLQIHPLVEQEKQSSSIVITIITPETARVKVATQSGNIVIKNLDGEIEAHTDSGNITIIDGSHNATMHTKDGAILLQRETMQNTDLIKATTDKGSITLQVPQYINSFIQAQTKKGKIYSDLLVTVEPKITKLNNAVYKEQKQSVTGSLQKDKESFVSGNIYLETKHGTIFIKNYV